jgi:hypothetical protein
MVNIDVLLDCGWMQSAKPGVSRASTKETFAFRGLFSLGQIFFGQPSARARQTMRHWGSWLWQIAARYRSNPARANRMKGHFFKKIGNKPD